MVELSKSLVACPVRLFVVIVAGLAAFVTVFISTAGGAGSSNELIHRKDSLYQQILVYKNDSTVSLKFNRRSVAIQSRVDLQNPREFLLEYTKMSFAGLFYKPEPKRVLVVGMGGGVIPREMRHYYPDTLIDVVEIDGAIPSIATKYFGFKADDKMKVHVMDGRMYIRRQVRKQNEKYDYIVLDAFNSEYIPYHLMTREFLVLVKKALAEDGVIVANVFHGNKLFDYELKTFIDVFAKADVYMGGSSGNAMIVVRGSGGKYPATKDLRAVARELQKNRKFSFKIERLVNTRKVNVKPSRKSYVLTDDKAPVNKLREQNR